MKPSVDVGTLRDAVWRGELVRTGIFEEQVPGPVALRRHDLAGRAGRSPRARRRGRW